MMPTRKKWFACAVVSVAALSTVMLGASAASASSIQASWHEVSSVAASTDGYWIPTTTPNGSQILVPNPDAGTVEVFSAASGQLVNTITVSGHPFMIAVSPDGSTAYVSEAVDPSTSMTGVAVIPIATDTTASSPASYIDIWTNFANNVGIAVAPDGQTLYVTSFEQNEVVAIPTASPTSTQRFAISSPEDLAISPSGDVIYVSQGTGRVSAISPSGTVLSSVAVAVNGNPSSLALSPTDPTRLLVVDSVDSTVTPIVSTNGTSMVAGAPIAVSGANWIAYSPDGTAAFVTDDDDGTVAVIDTGAHTVTSTVSITGGVNGAYAGGVTVSPDGTKVYADMGGLPDGSSRLVTLSGTAPTITQSTVPSGTQGTFYSHAVTATGDPTVTLSLTSGTLPAGMSFEPLTGLITGTPTSPGSYSFTITASNTFGTTDQAYTLLISAAAARTPTPSPTSTAVVAGASVNAGGTLRASSSTNSVWGAYGEGSILLLVGLAYGMTSRQRRGGRLG